MAAVQSNGLLADMASEKEVLSTPVAAIKRLAQINV